MTQVIQKVEDRKQSTFSKAQVIAASRRIHKSSVSNVWLVESESVKSKFYAVQYLDIPELQRNDLICDCAAFTYGVTVPCKHIISVSIKETS